MLKVSCFLKVGRDQHYDGGMQAARSTSTVFVWPACFSRDYSRLWRFSQRPTRENFLTAKGGLYGPVAFPSISNYWRVKRHLNFIFSVTILLNAAENVYVLFIGITLKFILYYLNVIGMLEWRGICNEASSVARRGSSSATERTNHFASWCWVSCIH